ncbi:hypothetical protein MUS_2510 [Bacillus velezensis YAU B9601-Y2]|uniref:Uncharacterized protein n=1 Tax=Bacillus amyloliquefaciens (strain Y2) TaxID=1155777 RepID=I2C715_BACAY|nr:hypothetical protein MUS_2510 [Bacillus velezensis YAU B9601-Y2]
MTGTTSAPSSFIRNTFSDWRATSSSPIKTVHLKPNFAAAVAAATPCCPAPVSAMIFVLPIFLASRIWPSALLIL